MKLIEMYEKKFGTNNQDSFYHENYKININNYNDKKKNNSVEEYAFERESTVNNTYKPSKIRTSKR